MIHMIKDKASAKEIEEMREEYDLYIKVAVDVETGVLAGGGVMHRDCEDVLLTNGSKQENIWGAGYYPLDKAVDFTSMINIRPAQNNRGQEVINEERREAIEKIIRARLES